MFKFISLLFVFSAFYSVVISQVNSDKLEKDSSCYLIRFSRPFEKREVGKSYRKQFHLLDICPQKVEGLAYPEAKTVVDRNGKKVETSFDVVKSFENEDDARKFTERHKIMDTPFLPISDCQIIRTIDFPLTKRPRVKTIPKLALLNTCLFDEEDSQRPSIEVIRNDKVYFRLFEVLKVFQMKGDAEVYAEQNGITDVQFELDLRSNYP